MGSKGARHGKVTVGGKAAARANWGDRLSRSAQLAEAVSDTMPRGRGRKDTKRWCRGKVGTEHEPRVEYRSQYGHACGWMWWYRGGVKDSGYWSCHHSEVCQRCGKVLRHLKAEECPVFAGQLEMARAGTLRGAAWDAYLATEAGRAQHGVVSGPEGSGPASGLAGHDVQPPRI